jgi:endoglucanase
VLLKELTSINGVSGDEDQVREYIIGKVKDYADKITTDAMGNLIVYKKGRSGKRKIMLSAHMDEVGFMVTGYGEGGVLKFRPIGGVDDRILPGQRVLVGPDKICGVIASKAIHLQDKEERSRNTKLKSLYIDIGAEKKEEAEKLVQLGDSIYYDSDYVEFCEGQIKAKALDDRVGCAVMIEAIKGDYEFDLYLTFTVQEEIGTRGSEVAAFTVEPDLAFVMEGTTCSDVPDVKDEDQSTHIGEGAALTFLDRTSYPDKKLVSYLFDLAKEKNIKVQYKQTASGGNDAGKIQRSTKGVKVTSISVPCRYIHSPVSVMSMDDFNSVKALVLAALESFNDTEKLENIINGGI